LARPETGPRFLAAEARRGQWSRWRSKEDALFNHLIGADEQRGRDGKAEPALAVLRLMTKSILVTCGTSRSAGLGALENLAVLTPAWRPHSARLPPVSHKAAGHGEFTIWRNHGVADGQRDNLFGPALKE
jgi:hypothetical protein